jgi:hypothetical protein
VPKRNFSANILTTFHIEIVPDVDKYLDIFPLSRMRGDTGGIQPSLHKEENE